MGEKTITGIIADDDVARHLTMAECIAAMGTAFGKFLKGKVRNPRRCRYQARHPEPARRYRSNHTVW